MIEALHYDRHLNAKLDGKDKLKQCLCTNSNLLSQRKSGKRWNKIQDP